MQQCFYRGRNAFERCGRTGNGGPAIARLSYKGGHLRVGGQLSARPYGTAPTESIKSLSIKGSCTT